MKLNLIKQLMNLILINILFLIYKKDALQEMKVKDLIQIMVKNIEKVLIFNQGAKLQIVLQQTKV
jgi:hypothetical protein